MPVQDNTTEKGAENHIVSEEEKLRQQKQNEQESNFQKSEKLLPFLNIKAEFHQDRIDTLDSKIVTQQNKIAQNTAKIVNLNAKAERLEDRNKMLKATLGNLPIVASLISKNEKKIADIRENKIPKREQKIAKCGEKLEKFTAKKSVISHKLNRVVALNDTIKSFSLGLNKERRAVFAEAMDRLNQSTMDCLSDKKSNLAAKKSNLLNTYNSHETSVLDKHNLQIKIDDISVKISNMDNKIDKLKQDTSNFAKQNENTIDTVMTKTADAIANMSDKENITIPELVENTLSVVTDTLNLEKVQPQKIASEEKSTERKVIDNKVNPDFYNTLPKEERHIEAMTAYQADKVMNKLDNLGIKFSAAFRSNGKTAITVSKNDISTLKSVLQDSIKEIATARENKEEVKTVNKDYYRSLPKSNRFTSTEARENGNKIMKQLKNADIPFSAVQRSNDVMAITVAKESSQSYKQISSNVKGERAKQFINPEFYKALPAEFRVTHKMTEEQAKNTVEKLEQKGIAHSAVLNGDKSAVTVSKKDEKRVFFTRSKLKKEVQRLSNTQKNKEQPKKFKAKNEQKL